MSHKCGAGGLPAAKRREPNLPLSAMFLIISFIFPTLVHAEIIQLKNGNAIETKILKEDDNFVVVEAQGGKVKIPKTNIQTIWRGTKGEFLEVRGKEVYFAKGVELYRAGRFADAAENFEQAGNPNDTNPLLYANLGSAYASLGDAAKAEENFLKALEKKPNDPTVLLNLAHLYETGGKYKLAVPYYQRFLLQSDDPSAKRSLAYCSYMSGDFLGAAKLFEELGQKNDTVSLCNSAAAYIQAGELDRASAILGPLLEHPFPIPRAYLLMAEISRRYEDYAGAGEYYKKASERDPDTAKVDAGLGRLYLDMQQWDKAEAVFEKALEKDPGSFAVLYGLAKVAAQKKEFAKAEDLYEKLLKTNPKDVALLNDKGLLYLKMDEPRKALEVYRDLFRIDDRYAKGHVNAGLAYAFLEDADRALAEWTLALELDPKLDAAARNKKLLEDAIRGSQDEKTTPK